MILVAWDPPDVYFHCKGDFTDNRTRSVINIEAYDKTATHWAARGIPLHYITKQLQNRAFRGFPLCSHNQTTEQVAKRIQVPRPLSGFTSQSWPTVVHCNCTEWLSLMPRPHPLMRKGVWWTLSNFLVVPSQQSWYWTTQWNSATSCNHVLNQPTYL